MNDLDAALARISEIERDLSLERDCHAHDVWSSCGCLNGSCLSDPIGHKPWSAECPFRESDHTSRGAEER